MGAYTEGWNEYRRYRRDLLLVFAGWIPFGACVAELSNSLLHSYTPAFIAAFGYMLLFVSIGIRYQLFRCPRCGEWFAGTWLYSLSFLARRCVHCGLPKFSEDGN